MNVVQAINQSCDIFFYNVGARFYERWEESEEQPAPDIFQDYLRSWGFGSLTGLDIPGEMAGRVPDSVWKRKAFSEYPEGAQWQPGDMTNMVIGQGDLLVTPLQIANGYAGIARRKLVAPHLLDRVVDKDGNTIVSYTAKEFEQQPEFEDYSVALVEQGLQSVIWRLGGAWNDFPVQVVGKTGTAEVASAAAEFNWFVAYAPLTEPKYCVACVIEQGGYGSTVANVCVQRVLAKIYGLDLGDIEIAPPQGWER